MFLFWVNTYTYRNFSISYVIVFLLFSVPMAILYARSASQRCIYVQYAAMILETLDVWRWRKLQNRWNCLVNISCLVVKIYFLIIADWGMSRTANFARIVALMLALTAPLLVIFNSSSHTLKMITGLTCMMDVPSTIDMSKTIPKMLKTPHGCWR